MNPINYTTLEQSKRLAELGYPQDKTDCVWIFLDNRWQLHAREWLALGETITKDFAKKEWYAAPNAQEIELKYHPDRIRLNDDGIGDIWASKYIKGTQDNPQYKQWNFGLVHHAQARADALIWELENNK